MNIVNIVLYQCNTPFIFPFHSPQVIRNRADSILVKLLFDNGISGYGESAPRPYVTGESPELVRQEIENHFAKILFNRDIRSLEDIEKVLDKLETDCLERDGKAYHSALGSIDIALLDAMGKFKNLSPPEFLHPIVSDNIFRSLSIPLVRQDTIRSLYPTLMQIPFNSIKILLDGNLRSCIERVDLIRSLFGDQIDIRLEANGKWSRQQAVTFINELKKFNISAIEQPVNPEDVEGLRYVRIETGIPVIADESMCSLADAQYLIEKEACDIINIKISKCGGLLRSWEIASFAQSRNIPCIVGSHVGETRILYNAGRYFAMTLSNLYSFDGFSYLLYEDGWYDDHAKLQTRKFPPGLSTEHDFLSQSVEQIASLSSE